MQNNSSKFSLKDAFYIESGYPNDYKISWKMTNWCPYHCSYCYMSNAVEAAKAKKDNPTQEQLEQKAEMLNEYLKTHCDENKRVKLHLIGGEVAVFDLRKIVEKIPRVKLLIIATNFYRDVEYWGELKEYLRSRNCSLGISASFHLEMLKEEQRWKFCEKLQEISCQMKAVVSPKNIEEYKPYFQYVIDHNLGLEITLERDNENKALYNDFTKEQQSYIDYLRNYQYQRKNKRGDNFYFRAHLKDGTYNDYTSNISMLNNTKEGILDFSGFYCNAGENNIRINQKGDILRSACRLCSTYMKLGNILDKSSWVDQKDLKPFICDCNFKDAKGIKKLKGCTCFNNTEMWQQGYNRETKIFNENVNIIKIPNYFEMYKNSGQLKDCDWERQYVKND